jgi:hypothetical protein
MAIDIKEFNRMLTEYYSEHVNEYVKNMTLQYVDKTYNKNKLGYLFTAIIKSHTFKYGYPDVSAIEKAHNLYTKNGGNDLRNPGSHNEWKVKSKPLTEEDRKSAKAEHDRFLEFSKKISADKVVKKEQKLCVDCQFISEGKNSYECRGCINHSKFQPKI